MKGIGDLMATNPLSSVEQIKKNEKLIMKGIGDLMATNPLSSVGDLIMEDLTETKGDVLTPECPTTPAPTSPPTTPPLGLEFVKLAVSQIMQSSKVHKKNVRFASKEAVFEFHASCESLPATPDPNEVFSYHPFGFCLESPKPQVSAELPPQSFLWIASLSPASSPV